MTMDTLIYHLLWSNQLNPNIVINKGQFVFSLFFPGILFVSYVNHYSSVVSLSDWFPCVHVFTGGRTNPVVSIRSNDVMFVPTNIMAPPLLLWCLTKISHMRHLVIICLFPLINFMVHFHLTNFAHIRLLPRFVYYEALHGFRLQITLDQPFICTIHHVCITHVNQCIYLQLWNR
jgi:hypothetical protein